MTDNKMSKFKEGIVTIRETVIVLILGAIFVFPSFVKGVVEELGFSEIDFFGLKAKFENEADLREATQIGEMELQLGVFQDKVDSLTKGLESCATNPIVNELVTNLNNELSISKNSMKERSNLLKSKIVVQQEVLKNSSTINHVSIRGWLYIGEISEDKKTWKDDKSKHIISKSPIFKEDQILRLSQDVYLRQEGANLEQSKAEITAVVPKGTNLKFQEIKYSHAKAGGWFAWILVEEIRASD